MRVYTRIYILYRQPQDVEDGDIIGVYSTIEKLKDSMSSHGYSKGKWKRQHGYISSEDIWTHSSGIRAQAFNIDKWEGD